MENLSPLFIIGLSVNSNKGIFKSTSLGSITIFEPFSLIVTNPLSLLLTILAILSILGSIITFALLLVKSARSYHLVISSFFNSVNPHSYFLLSLLRVKPENSKFIVASDPTNSLFTVTPSVALDIVAIIKNENNNIKKILILFIKTHPFNFLQENYIISIFRYY